MAEERHGRRRNENTSMPLHVANVSPEGNKPQDDPHIAASAKACLSVNPIDTGWIEALDGLDNTDGRGIPSIPSSPSNTMDLKVFKNLEE